MGKSLIETIERFGEKHGLSDSAFGKKALNNEHFVRDLRAERHKPRRSTLKKIRDFMDRVDADPSVLDA